MPNDIKILSPAGEDIEAVLRVEEEAWPEGIRASREQFLERLRIFPEGFFLGELNREIVGVLTSQLLEYKFGEVPLGWEKTTNHGWISATHRGVGNALYIVSVGVAKRAQRKGIGSALVKFAQNFAKRRKLEYIILDSRLPEYKPFFESGISPKDYIARSDGNFEPVDPELRFYQRLGFKILSPSQVISSCMDNDAESASFGVRMVWINSYD